MPNPDGTVAWRELLEEAKKHVPANEARWLVEEAAGFEPGEFTVGLDELCTTRGVARFDAMLARRRTGEPIQYVLGHWAFRGLDLMVDRRVLIPRPETEVLVDLAIDLLNQTRASHNGPLIGADLGTGSGAIAYALVTEVPDLSMFAVERSMDALAVATANLAGLGSPARRVTLTQGSWFEPLADGGHKLHIITANPPYVPSTDALPDEVANWEPTEALLAGPDGTDDLVTIINEAPEFMAPDGSLILELDPRQTTTASQAAQNAGLTNIRIHQDLAGRDRFMAATKP